LCGLLVLSPGSEFADYRVEVAAVWQTTSAATFAFGTPRRAVGHPNLTEQTRRVIQVGAPKVAAHLRDLVQRSGVPHRVEGQRIILSTSVSAWPL
jgi:hypothetical protein